MSKSDKLKEQYYNEFGAVDISYDTLEGRLNNYINTTNYYSVPLYSKKTTFDEYEDDIQTLYNIIFNNPTLMKSYFYEGETLTIEQFESLVNLNSIYCKLFIPFVGYIIYNKEDDKVVGYETIKTMFDDTGNPVANTGHIAYVIAQEYQGKKAGSENLGAFILYYGEKLSNLNYLINTYFDHTKQQFVLGTNFEELASNVFRSNIPSSKILIKYGFTKTETHYEPDHEVYDTYVKNYIKDALPIIGDIDHTHTELYTAIT